ncbi:MAG: fused MFS/spermidine synthase, partial [Myxococcota bacterium]
MSPVLVALFVVSGATSLVYQSVWARELHLVLGTSQFAVSVVLAAFMGGLGLGGALAGRYARTVARPLRVYGALELGIGAYAVAFPVLVRGITPLYVAVAGIPGADAVHGLLAAAVLLPPTVAMGATLPLLTRLVTDRRGTVGDRVAVLYAANTAGAVAGTALAGLWLLPTIGLHATTITAATGNAALGLVAIGADRLFSPVEPDDDLARDEVGALGPAAVAPWLAFLAGAAALGCEVTWTRLVALILGGSTYAFTAMLLAVLLGIAIGGRFAGPLADDALRARGTAGVLATFGWIQLALAVLGVGSTFVWPLLPYLFVWTFDGFDGKHHPDAVFVASFGCAIGVLLPQAIAMGA